MIGIPKESNPVQINRILSEAYAREKALVREVSRNFVIPSANKLRKGTVSKPPTTRNDEISSDDEHQIDILTEVSVRSRRLDWAALDRISVSLPPKYRCHASNSSNDSDLDMEELTSIVSGKSRSSSMVGGLFYPVDTPMTSSHAIGWVVCPEVTNQKWKKPKVTNPIVRYAEIYYKQNRINPFKNNPHPSV
jgi:hypothetical protein